MLLRSAEIVLTSDLSETMTISISILTSDPAGAAPLCSQAISSSAKSFVNALILSMIEFAARATWPPISYCSAPISPRSAPTNPPTAVCSEATAD